ncbi:glycosyltransferase family 2 protein [Anabaenopsis sp. FSS-46]|uniref:glycosyltransferase family 2 protein n=1 Tax=Anabaenopsis sp. FSS-46 TaxID=2971766 RepID=UPI002475A76C|nr:glycosyltransferase family 2 protein [Anabaenopsis sp. FSS-46]MDH6099303.1 glycosyltransferase family 2 protein [Anabaenopsis sp. FSS-46]
MLPKYSFIVPIYNEAENILEMYRRISQVMNQMDGKVELCFVNDGSRDLSLKIISELHQKDSRVVYLSLARNFGHQIAVTAGLNFVRGEVTVILDADLQDPPELITEMVELWKQGYHIVYAQRIKRSQESWLKRLTAYAFYRILQRLADVTIPTDAGDFCLLDRQVVNVLNKIPERNRYIRGLRSWVGFNQTAIRFERDPRFAGDPKYTFGKSFALAINGIVSFSKVPLRISTYLGLLAAFVSLLMCLLVLYWRIFIPNSPLTGVTIILMAVFFLGAVQLISIGILGEYIGRIYEEVKQRPLYVLSEVAGFEEESELDNY